MPEEKHLTNQKNMTLDLRERNVKKNKISYWNSIFSITTVLFLTGFLGLFVIIAKNTSDILKESITIHVELSDADSALYDQFRLKYQNKPEVKKVEFVHKDQAAQKLQDEIKEDFISNIGFNPLYNSFDININSEFFTPEILEKLKKEIQHESIVLDASYPKVVSKSLDKNFKKVSIIIGAITFILLLIAIVLIDSTIRLAMFSDRFIIKSMQLVGATRWFIIKPYIWRSILNGILSAFIAFGILVLVLNLISHYTELIDLKSEVYHLINVFIGLFFLGITISSISTFFAVHKYLRTKLDSLY
jgi:cell division transport system permease protein